MEWRKRGRVYGPDGRTDWALHSCLTPTPLLMGDTIRVYSGFRDAAGVSRIGYVDVCADNPGDVLAVSARPALDIGEPGAFDDNGVILGDVVRDGALFRMYYVGFQKVDKVKFLAFTGLAVSDDGGLSFQRVHKAPILDRSDEGLFIRAIHSVRPEGGGWRAWYAAGDGWEMIRSQPYPRYHIRTLFSADGVRFSAEGEVCLRTSGDEYRIGRPRVYERDGRYEMWFTKGTPQGDYTPGSATSSDGIRWHRDDSRLGIGLSPHGFDSRHLCYPSLVEAGAKTWMFYNGNDMGIDGFGYAELVG